VSSRKSSERSTERTGIAITSIPSVILPPERPALNSPESKPLESSNRGLGVGRFSSRGSRPTGGLTDSNTNLSNNSTVTSTDSNKSTPRVMSLGEAIEKVNDPVEGGESSDSSGDLS